MQKPELIQKIYNFESLFLKDQLAVSGPEKLGLVL